MAQTIPTKPVQLAHVVNDDEVAVETQKSIAKGKEALEKHLILEAFDLLFIPSLSDSHAMRLMMKLINQYQRMRLITDEQIKRNQVESFAEKGYPMAQYVLGRYHQMVKPEKDSIKKAKKWYDAAKKAGLGDAFASEAMLVVDGYYGPVDLDLYHSLIKEGFQKGYTKDYCSLSFYRMLVDKVLGLHGTNFEPQTVIDTIKDNIGSTEREDIDEIDPVYYKILGDAYSKLGNIEEAREYYAKAIDMGYVECCSNFAISIPPNENFTHEAWGYWEQMNMTGCQLNDPYSYVLASVCFETPYDELSDDKKRERTAQIKETLLRSYALGEEFGAYLLGYNYYHGENGFEQNHEEAWRWFNNAAFWEDFSGFTMAAKMIENGEAPERFDQNWSDYFYLQALRRGDVNQLGKVVEIYRAGRLTDFAKEIETLYILKYKEPPTEEPVDEPMDDDGRFDAWS